MPRISSGCYKACDKENKPRDKGIKKDAQTKKRPPEARSGVERLIMPSFKTILDPATLAESGNPKPSPRNHDHGEDISAAIAWIFPGAVSKSGLPSEGKVCECHAHQREDKTRKGREKPEYLGKN